MAKIIDFFKENIKVIIVVAILLTVLIFYLSNEELGKKTIYTVVNGSIESSIETNLYLIKNETVIDYDKTQAITSIIDQGKRTSKNEAIATPMNALFLNNNAIVCPILFLLLFTLCTILSLVNLKLKKNEIVEIIANITAQVINPSAVTSPCALKIILGTNIITKTLANIDPRFLKVDNAVLSSESLVITEASDP